MGTAIEPKKQTFNCYDCMTEKDVEASKMLRLFKDFSAKIRLPLPQSV
jgi:hypothetical protein